MGKNIWFGLVVDTGPDKNYLKNLARKYKQDFMDGWELKANHATISFKDELPKNYKFKMHQEVKVTVTHIGWNDSCLAVKIKGVETFNHFPHITLAFNKSTGKGGYMSNFIKEWTPIENKEITCYVKSGYFAYPPKEGIL